LLFNSSGVVLLRLIFCFKRGIDYHGKPTI
jgi:hypothetical protein